MVVSGPTASDPTGPPPDPDRASPAGERKDGGDPPSKAPSIRTQLFRLVAAALLPALLFAAAASFNAYLSRRKAAELDLMQTSRAVSAALDAEFGRREAMLEGLATSPSLRSGDLQTFYLVAKAAAGAAPVALHDAATGRELLNTGLLPWESTIPLRPGETASRPGETASIAETVRARTSEVKDVYWSPLRRTYDVAIQTPVIVNGRVKYVLQMGEATDDLARVLERFKLPDASRVIVADRHGIRAASRNSAEAVGKPMTPQLLSQVRDGYEGVSRGPSFEGEPTVAAITRSPVSGFSVVVGVPAAEFTASLLRAAAWVFAIGLAASALGLALAAWMARRIAQPLRAAAEAARSIGRGGRVRLGPTGVSETDVIAGALGEASQALAQRSAERDRLEAELEARVRARTGELDAANKALAESEARLRAIFDSTFQLTGLVTLDGHVVAVNRAALEAGNATAEQVIGKALWDTPWWAGTPKVRAQLPNVFRRVAAGEFVRTEVRMNLPAGLRVFDYSMRPLYLHGGERPDHVLVEGRDVTDLKAAMERANRSQKMEALGLLTGSVAHDFNNILTVVKGAIESALKGKVEPQGQRVLEAAMEAAQRGEVLNKQLLGLARKSPETQVVSLDVGKTVERMEPLLRNAVGASRKLVLEISSPPGACMVEAAQFETALLNLVVNARDATPEGGVVTVAVHAPTPEQLSRMPPIGSDIVLVEVADTGQGIAPENLARVFDPFFTTKPPGEGTGLGLSQVYAFVDQSKGHIDVQSALGRGTRVTMALPIDRSAGAEAKAADPPPARLAPLKVLLVQDDPLVSDVSEAMLRDLGHKVTSTRTAQQALQAVDEGGFDLLLADVVMPEGMNGLQLARAVLERRPALKVLLVSDPSAEASGGTDLSQIPWPVLQKPFGGEDLQHALASATGAAAA